MYRDCLEKNAYGWESISNSGTQSISFYSSTTGDDGTPSTLLFSALMEMIAAHMQSLQIKKNNEKLLGLK